MGCLKDMAHGAGYQYLEQEAPIELMQRVSKASRPECWPRPWGNRWVVGKLMVVRDYLVWRGFEVTKFILGSAERFVLLERTQMDRSGQGTHR